MSVRLGYACICMTLKKDNIYTNRTTTVKVANTKGTAFLKELGKKNVTDLLHILKFNEEKGIRFYRLSSDMFPHWGNPKVKPYDIEFARESLQLAGKFAKDHGHRITMHPGQYTQLGSTKQSVIDQSIKDINNHAQILTMMGLSNVHGSVIIIHGGGTFGNKELTLQRLAENYEKISPEAKQLLIIENDDHHYTIRDLLPLCKLLKIPMCIDFFHHLCNNNEDTVEEYVKEIMDIWGYRGMKPKCHWSSQKPNARKGAHSNCMPTIPSYIFDICRKYSADLMIEAKDKELCTLEMYKKYYIKYEYHDSSQPRVEWMLK